MKSERWAYLAAILLLLVLILRVQFCSKPNPVEVVRWRSVDLDSLKAALGYDPDSLIAPIPPFVEQVPLVVTLKDTATVDSLIRVYNAQRLYYSDLLARLEGAVKQRETERDALADSLDRLVLLERVSVYEDSAQTASYFHRWKIEAEGPLRSYAYTVIPICPQPVLPVLKNNRVFIGVGAQGQAGALRQVYLAGYGYKWAWVQAGYLPPVRSLSLGGAVQVAAGVTVPF